MDVLMGIIRLLVTIMIAFLAGKLVSRLRLPAILGWLITGMVMGPYAVNLLSNAVLNASWFVVTEKLLECTVGLMIGTELIWRQMKKAGKQILVTTVTESLGTFLVVSLVFGILFRVSGIPIYLAFVFGGIALATAPAPSLSIVNEMKTSGPVTRTLIPMAALDDLVGALVFFLVIALVSANLSAQDISVAAVLLLVFLPVLLGIVTGALAGLIMRHTHTAPEHAGCHAPDAAGIGGAGLFHQQPTAHSGAEFYADWYGILHGVCQHDYAGAAGSDDAGNESCDRFCLIVAILNIGAPLDYHLIFGAGAYTAVYIIARAAGKYSGAYFGGAVTHAPRSVKRYLGFTLLPHSGVSLVFTGIAVSVLSGPAPEYASIVQGTIAAAAVINEIIAVFMAKKGFEWAGELHKAEEASAA